MTVKTQVVYFIKSTTAGSNVDQEVNLSSNFGVPKACILVGCGTNLENTTDAQMAFSYGFSDGTNHFCMATHSEDASGLADSSRASQSGFVYLKLSDANNNVFTTKGTVLSFTNNKVTLRWTTNDNRGEYLMLIVFGGNDLSLAKVGWAQITAGTGNKNYTGLGFNPRGSRNSVVFLASAAHVVNDGTIADNSIGALGVGVNPRAHASPTMGAVHWSVEHNPTTMDSYRGVDSGRILRLISNVDGTTLSEIDFNAWITDGFQLNYISNSGGLNCYIGWLVIDGGIWDLAWPSTPATPTNNVNTSFPNFLSHAIRGLIVLHHGHNATGASAHAEIGVGMSDGTNECMLVTSDEDAVATSDTYRVIAGGNNILRMTDPATGNTLNNADLVSFGNNQITLNHTAANLARFFCMVAVADETFLVTKTNTLKFDVRSAVTKTNTLKFDVRQALQATRTLKFNILNTVTKTNNLLFSILQTVMKTSTLLFDVEEIELTPVTKTTTLKFDIMERVTKTSTLKFDLREQVAFTRTLLFNIRNAMEKQVTLKFDVRALVTKQCSILFNLNQQVIKTLNALFSIYNPLEATRTIKFDVRNTVEKNNTLRFDIRSEVTKQCTILFDVMQAVTKTLTMMFSIHNTLEATRTIRFDTRNTVEKSNTIRFDVRESVEKDLTVRFDILQQAIKELNLKFDILEKISKTTTLLFDIEAVGVVIKTLNLKFDILQRMDYTRTIKFDILNELEKTITINFDILNLVEKTLPIKFDIMQAVEKAATIKFDIRNELEKILNIKFDVRQMAQNTTRIKFDVRNVVEMQRTLRFHIRNELEKQLSIRFDVRQLAEKTATIKFDTIARVEKQVTIKFDIRNKVEKTIQVLFTLNQLVEKDTTLKFDILQRITKLQSIRFDVEDSAEIADLINDVIDLTSEFYAAIETTRILGRIQEEEDE